MTDKYVLSAIFCLGLLVSGCGKKAEPATPVTSPATQEAPQPAASAPTAPPAQPVVIEAQNNNAEILSALTQAVRRYGMEKRRVPASLGEVVSAGYVKGMPAAPAGKKYVIDPKRMEVVLANQ